MSKSVEPQVYFESDLQASRLQPEEEKFQSQQVNLFDEITIIEDHIPKETIPFEKYEKVLIEAATKPNFVGEVPPFFSKVYGKIRQETYQNFLKLNRQFDYLIQQRNNQMFVEIDQKASEKLYSHVGLIDAYNNYQLDNQLNVSALFDKESLHKIDNDKPEIQALKTQVQILSIMWYILMDKATDTLEKTELYGLLEPADIKQEKIYKQMKMKWAARDQVTWKAWGIHLWAKALGSIKGYLEKVEAFDNDLTLEGIVTFLGAAFTTESIERQLESIEENSQEEFLEKMKRFLKELIKEVENIIKEINNHIYVLSGPSKKSVRDEHQKKFAAAIEKLTDLKTTVNSETKVALSLPN